MYAALTFFGNGKLICKSSSAADNGKTVSVTDGKRTWSATLTDGVCTFTLPAKQKYTVCLLNGDNAEYVTEVIFGFGEYHELEVGMDKTTWKGLKAIVNAGLEAEMLAVGDQIIATVGGETQRFDILHIDYRKGVYGNNIIVGKNTCLTEGRVLKDVNDNSGGYASTLVATYLDGEYYEGLPADMKAVITEMSWLGSAGSKNTTQIMTEKHKVWVPMEWNVLGEKDDAAVNEHDVCGAEQFAYFAAGNKVKPYGETGVAARWWTSSPAYAANTNNGLTWSYVGENGSCSQSNMATSYAILPCFMIAADAE